MANTTNTRHTCQECGHCKMGLCTKSNQAVRATQYACHRFQTLMQIAGLVPNLPDRPDLIIAALTNVICEQLENGGGIINNLNL